MINFLVSEFDEVYRVLYKNLIVLEKLFSKLTKMSTSKAVTINVFFTFLSTT